jgi:hypothetical protein
VAKAFVAEEKLFGCVVHPSVIAFPHLGSFATWNHLPIRDVVWVQRWEYGFLSLEMARPQTTAHLRVVRSAQWDEELDVEQDVQELDKGDPGSCRVEK